MLIYTMETKINELAWDILNEDERTALSLGLGHGKSTWESGEIMGKAHFKYLEIQKRAQKFLEIFTNHFTKYDGLFPVELTLSFPFKEYLQLTILERLNISKATRKMEDQNYSIATRRNKLIIREIEKLRSSTSEAALDLYSLIMDFDRWNNFRILPLEIQEPSAFKRRNKARNNKHLKNLTTLPQFSIIKIKENFSYRGKYPKLYLPIISNYLDNGYMIVSIKDEPKVVNKITSIGLFLFPDRAKAEEFARLISDYYLNCKKSCRTGQKFWPEFRVLIIEASNYKKIENIHKSRTYLDKAIFDLDSKKVKARKQKVQKGEERTDDEKLFYTQG